MVYSILLWSAMAQAAMSQQPKSVITGPKEAPTGELVILDASQSQGLGYLWILVDSEKSFLPVDNGLKCVFSTGTPGQYIFVLVVSGTNSNGGPAVATAKHVLKVTGNNPPPPVVKPDTPSDPTKPSDPPTDPNLKIDRVTYVYEKDQNSVPPQVERALNKINADSSFGIVASHFEDDTVDGDNETPEQYKIAWEAAVKNGLPTMVFQSGKTVVKMLRDPQTEEQVMGVIR
jgi:hypothetical protein